MNIELSRPAVVLTLAQRIKHIRFVYSIHTSKADQIQ